MITAPYNFVPLSKKVVAPYWGPLVSHDRPFEQGLSGVLDLEIEAISPIYVRNGEKREENQDPDTSFNNLNGKYYIPGTSIKGMLRSMVEIMSFGSMVDKVEDVKYSVRDWANDKIYPKSAISKESLAGWLRVENGKYFLKPCGRPGRISHKSLDDLCNTTKISKFFENKANFKHSDEFKSAKNKYDLFQFEKNGHGFVLEDEEESEDGIGRAKYKLDPLGKKIGTIVFTGQAGPRNAFENKGKQYEFIFFDSKREEVEVPEEVVKSFLLAYYDQEKNQQKPDWKWRKGQLKNNECIPVFYRTQKDGLIKDMGLTLLFKISYNYSVKDIVSRHQLDFQEQDLADTIFGFSNSEKSLKGRIQVGHAFAEGNPKVVGLKKEVLAGPKASYYPNYIEQKETKGKLNGDYQTLMNKGAEIRGWKRYPLRAAGLYPNPAPNGNDKITTKFIPLDQGTKFKLSINYHNLRSEELGAIVSALTFHQSSGYFHSLGMGKPLGFGKVKLGITNMDASEILNHLKSFEWFMNVSLENHEAAWHLSDQLTELFAMARPNEKDLESLKYMELKEFIAAKGTKKTDPKFALQKYSAITGESIQVNSLITDSELTDYKIKYKEEKARFDQLASTDKSQFWFEMHLAQAKKSSEELQLARKTALLEMLKIKEEQILEEKKELKNRILEETRIQRQKADDEAKKERDQDKIEGGVNLTGIPINGKGFEVLSKRVITFAEALHGKRVATLRQEGIPYLPLESRAGVSKMIVLLYENSNKKDKSMLETRPIKSGIMYQKFVNWMGEEETITIYERLNIND